MDPHAITARLRTTARLLAERGIVSKEVDMSRAAVTDRLRTMTALASMCLRLGKATVTDGVGRPGR